MAYKNIEIGTEMHKFVLNEPVEGEYKDVQKEVGENKSYVYTVGDKTFWGASALDLLMSKVEVGSKLRITLVEENYKFPSGRVGKNFKLEVDK